MTTRRPMKVSKELADVLRQASEEVDAWPKWKRSLDPIGERSQHADQEELESKAPNSLEDESAA
jgi:hypothetical protein